MRNFRFVGLLMLLSIAFMSCKQGNKRGPLTPTSSGLPYELLVVMDQKYMDTPLGEAVTEVLTSNVPGLPQPEAAFKLMYTDPQHFDGILKPIRNLVLVKVDRVYTEPRFNTASDVYAYPQSVVTIQGPTEESLAEYVSEHGSAIVDYFTKAEMNRQIAILEKNHNKSLADTVKEMFGSDVWVSGDLKSTKTGEDFFWAGTNEGTSERFFMVYSIPYEDDNAFTPEYMIHKRDSVLRENVLGANEGSYMTTVADMTEVTPINVQGDYTLEARGLWRVVNDRMGGPFVAHMRLDKQNKRLIFVDTFVFAPEKMKRNLMRQMEASLYTLRLPGALAKEVEIANTESNKE